MDNNKYSYKYYNSDSFGIEMIFGYKDFYIVMNIEAHRTELKYRFNHVRGGNTLTLKYDTYDNVLKIEFYYKYVLSESGD